MRIIGRNVESVQPDAYRAGFLTPAQAMYNALDLVRGLGFVPDEMSAWCPGSPGNDPVFTEPQMGSAGEA